MSRRSNLLVRAFAISLVFHVTLFAGFEAGHQLGWWKHSIIAKWFTPKYLKQNTKTADDKKANNPSDRREPPLLFVEVAPAQASTEAPKDAKHYSAQNSIASNPDVIVESDIPKIDGTQTKVAKTSESPQTKPFPLQPAPLALNKPEEKPEPKPIEEPEPDRQDAEPVAQPNPGAGELVMITPSPKPRENPQPLSASRPRPMTLAAARQQQGLIAGEKQRQEGGVKRRALESSLDVKATPFGAYDAAIVAAIQQRWYDLLDENDYARGRSGKVVLEFHLTNSGQITDMQVAENSVGDLLALICQRAVLDPAPFAPWPSDMRRLVGDDYREVRFTFYYN